MPSLWETVGESVGDEVREFGYAIVSGHLMAQVLAERIIGAQTDAKYSKALAVFNREFKIESEFVTLTSRFRFRAQMTG